MNETIEKAKKQCKCTTLLPSKPNAMSWPHPSQATMGKGNDVFQFGTSYYLIVANYYSLWPDIYLLNQPTTSCAIDGMEQYFQLISDNGPHYSLKQFDQFTKEWDIIHTTSGPKISTIKWINRGHNQKYKKYDQKKSTKQTGHS